MEIGMPAPNRPDHHQLVVVTGASTGMGGRHRTRARGQGIHVLAGVRRDVDADALRADGIEPHILDITDESDVAAIAGRVADDPLRRPLRALINNAGIAVNAPSKPCRSPSGETCSRSICSGHIAMTQALLPALLHSSGTVVNISSVGGSSPWRPMAHTRLRSSPSKLPVIRLRREVAPLGVKVVVVEPGAVKTRMAEHAVASADRVTANMTADQLNRYADLTAAISAQQLSSTKKGVPVERAAKVIANAVTASNRVPATPPDPKRRSYG